MLFSIILSLLVATSGSRWIQTPKLTGRYSVGTISFMCVDDSRVDPLAPTPQLRALMVSVFYPTSKSAIHKYHLAQYMSPAAAAALSQYLGTSGHVPQILTQSFLGASNVVDGDDEDPEFPTLFFSHGLNSSRLLHTAHLEQLASHGWVVVAVDHTYDAAVVEFPDGEVVPWRPTNLDDFPNELARLIAVRAADFEFVTQLLGNFTDTPYRLDRIGIFGHSLGGATAAQVLANGNPQFVCGANFDGGMFGPVATTGFDKPFVQMEAAGHNRSTEPTWPEFWDHLGGFRREFTVNGTLHSTFSDLPVLRDLLGDAFPSAEKEQLGTIAGERLLEIDTAFMDAFFTFCLKNGSSSDLDRLAQAVFPEVTIPQYDI